MWLNWRKCLYWRFLTKDPLMPQSIAHTQLNVSGMKILKGILDLKLLKTRVLDEEWVIKSHPCFLEVLPKDLWYRLHQDAFQKCKISDPTPDLLNTNLHLNRNLKWFVCTNLRNMMLRKFISSMKPSKIHILKPNCDGISRSRKVQTAHSLVD